MAQQKREKPRAQPDAVSVDWQAGPRAAQALRLRRLGYTYDAIAKQVGYQNESSARTAIKAANQRIIRDEAQALVGYQLDQLDLALHIVLKRIAADNSESLWAVDRLVPLLKRQAELMGLDVKPEALALAAPYEKRVLIVDADPSPDADVAQAPDVAQAIAAAWPEGEA